MLYSAQKIPPAEESFLPQGGGGGGFLGNFIRKKIKLN
jgi:hypothetical protein